MSIAEKLQVIAENEQKVFEAGKRAVLKDSKYMNATASGAAVALPDVSSVEHEVAVQLSSEVLTDFSAVTVKRYGKNLLPFPYKDKTKSAGGITFTANDDGTITANGTATSDTVFVLCGGSGMNAMPLKYAFVTGETYVYSTGAILPAGVEICNFLYDANGKTHSGRTVSSGTHSKTLTISEDNLRLYSYFRIAKSTVLDNFTIYPMIEKGATATEYEPYIVTEHTPHADGLVTLPNLSPVMTLATDTDGVTIDCSYLRDIDTYIDNLTMNVALTGGD